MTAHAPYVDPPTIEQPVERPAVEQPAWLTPDGIALTEAGFQVTVYPRGFPSVVALLDVGVHRVRVYLVQGQYWLVEQQRSEDDGRRLLVNEWWPETSAAAVALGVELAGDLKEAHDAEQEQAVIGDAVTAEMAADVAGAA